MGKQAPYLEGRVQFEFSKPSRDEWDGGRAVPRSYGFGVAVRSGRLSWQHKLRVTLHEMFRCPLRKGHSVVASF